MSTAHAPEVTINGSVFKGCACSCGQPVTSRSTYRPGHDARHVSRVARDAAAAYQREEEDVLAIYEQLPSPALRAKAARAALRIIKADGSAKTGRPAAAQEMTGEAKVGRWTYPARMALGGKAQRNTKRDGSGEWVNHTGEGIVWG